jgi:hypothetical protein
VRIDLEDAGIYTLPWLAYQGTLTDEQDPARRWRVQIFPSGLATGPGKLPPDEIEPWLRAAQADYVVMETSRTMRNLPAAAALEKAAQKIGERVYHASGQLTSMPGQGSHGEYQGANDFARWLLGRRGIRPRRRRLPDPPSRAQGDHCALTVSDRLIVLAEFPHGDAACGSR